MANVGKVQFLYVQHEGKIFKIAQGQLRHYKRAHRRGKNPKIEDYGRLVGEYAGELHPQNCATCNCSDKPVQEIDSRDTFHR